MKIKRALISVHDKSGIVDFAGELEKIGIEIIATSGTFKTLKNGGVRSVKKVSDVTEFPEILGGRVKTEHPRIMGGILALRDDEKHMKNIKRLGIKLIDMVVCNLYPFSEKVKQGIDLKSTLDSIDIGGPNIIRAAAKNLKNVVVVVSPHRYCQIIKELLEKGNISMKTRLSLAKETFQLTGSYDMAIQKLLRTARKTDVSAFSL